MFTPSASPDGPHHLSPGPLQLPPNWGELPNKNTGCPDKFEMMNYFTDPGRRITKQGVSQVCGDMVGGDDVSVSLSPSGSLSPSVPVSLWFQERQMAHCYGLQVDDVFGLIRITASFTPCPPSLRSPSEIGSLTSWPQMPSQLAAQYSLMATRHPRTPAPLCATL